MFSLLAGPFPRKCFHTPHLFRCTMALPFRTQVRHFHVPFASSPHLVEHFHQQLVNLSLHAIDKKECVEACAQPIKEWTHSTKIPFSAEKLSNIKAHLDTFNATIDEVSCLSADQVKSLKTELEQEIYHLVQEKWAGDLAEIFYNILEISNPTERVSAGQKWADDYFAALEQLYEWQSPSSIIPKEEIQKFLDTTLACLDTHSRRTDEETCETLIRQMEKGLPSPDSPMKHSPNIEDSKKLLKKCLLAGEDLRNMNYPYHDPKKPFQDIFTPDTRKE